MNGNKTCVFAFGHLRNADGEPSHSARVFMEERARRIAQDQNHDHALNEAILATEEESAFKTKLLTHLLERLGGRADYERLRALKKDRLERVKKLLSALPVLDSPGTPGGPFSNQTLTRFRYGGPTLTGGIQRANQRCGWTAPVFTSLRTSNRTMAIFTAIRSAFLLTSRFPRNGCLRRAVPIYQTPPSKCRDTPSGSRHKAGYMTLETAGRNAGSI
jgi:hypothetical protein